MKRSLMSAMLMLLASAAGANDPITGGNADAGAKLAAPCTACHGPGGNSSNPEWPKLAGQSGPYLVEQLKLFKNGVRNNPLMNPQAAGLSEQDMRDLAAYYASQDMTPGVAAESAVEVADPLHRAGDPERGLPACSACHGPAGNGNAAAGYPRLGGQHDTYLANTLRLFRSIDRGDVPMPENERSDSLKIMLSVAGKLTDAEIDALASYFQGLQ